MGVYIPNMDKPKRCAACEYADEDWWCNFVLDLSYANEKEQYEHCPLIEIDQEDEKAVLFLLRMRKAMREGKSLKEILDGERRTDPNNCKECELTNECDHHICLKAVRERRTDE